MSIFMKIPKKVSVGGQIYKVVEKKNLGSKGVVGSISFKKHIIAIKKDLDHQSKCLVFLHELTHAIFDHAGIKQNESKVERIAQCLFMILQENKELFQ